MPKRQNDYTTKVTQTAQRAHDHMTNMTNSEQNAFNATNSAFNCVYNIAQLMPFSSSPMNQTKRLDASL
jgi:hypothetical protein